MNFLSRIFTRRPEMIFDGQRLVVWRAPKGFVLHLPPEKKGNSDD